MKKLKISNCDNTQKLKLWQNLIIKIVTKLRNPNCVKLNTQIVTQLKNSNCDTTKKLKLWQNLNYGQSWFMKNKNTLRGSIRQNILTHWQPMRCSLGSVCNLATFCYELCRLGLLCDISLFVFLRITCGEWVDNVIWDICCGEGYLINTYQHIFDIFLHANCTIFFTPRLVCKNIFQMQSFEPF